MQGFLRDSCLLYKKTDVSSKNTSKKVKIPCQFVTGFTNSTLDFIVSKSLLWLNQGILE